MLEKKKQEIRHQRILDERNKRYEEILHRRNGQTMVLVDYSNKDATREHLVKQKMAARLDRAKEWLESKK